MEETKNGPIFFQPGLLMVLGKMGIEDVDLGNVWGWNRLAEKLHQLGIDVTVHEPQIRSTCSHVKLICDMCVCVCISLLSKHKNSITFQRRFQSAKTRCRDFSLYLFEVTTRHHLLEFGHHGLEACAHSLKLFLGWLKEGYRIDSKYLPHI